MKKIFTAGVCLIGLLMLAKQASANEMLIYPPGTTATGSPVNFQLLYCGTISGASCSASVTKSLNQQLSAIPYASKGPYTINLDSSISVLTIGNNAITKEPMRYCQYYVVNDPEIVSIDGRLVVAAQQGFQCYVGINNITRFDYTH